MKLQSPSSVNLYLSCPNAYRLHYLDHQPPVQIDDTPLRIGKPVHKILQHFYSGLNLNTTTPEIDFAEKLKTTAFEHWDRTIDVKKRDEINEALYTWLKYEIQRFKNYKEKNIIERFLPTTVEEEIKDYNIGLHCVIDKRCIGLSGNIYVVDYKTNKALPAKRNFNNNLSEIDTQYKVQAAINSLCLQSQGVKLDGYYFQFIRFPDKLLPIPITDKLHQEVLEIINKIRADTTFEKNKKSCFFCNYKIYCQAEETSIYCHGNEL